MALTAAFLPAKALWAGVIVLGFALALFQGVGHGALLIVPFALAGSLSQVTLAYVVMISLCLTGNREETRISSFIHVSAAAMAGFLFIRFFAPEFNTFPILEIIAQSAIIGAAASLTNLIPVYGSWRAALRGLVMVPLIFGLSQLDWSNIIFIYNPVKGAAASTVLGLLARITGGITTGGMFGGIVAGTYIYVTTGPKGFAMLAAFVILAMIASSASKYIMRRHPRHPEPLEEREKRGLPNLLANVGPALCFVPGLLLLDDPYIFIIGFSACLGSSLADTVSSELGQALGGRTVDIMTFARVNAGENGAISIEGTALGLGAAALTGLLAVGMEFSDPVGGIMIFTGASAGFIVDSLLGSVYENNGKMTNGQVNAWSSFAGGILAAYIAISL